MWANKDELVLRLFPFLRSAPVSPDVLSLLGVGLSAAGGLAFFFGRDFWAGGILLVAGWCDMVDGVVARLRERESLTGAFFDSTLDRVSDFCVFCGIALGGVATRDLGLASLALWALGGAVLTSYARARAEVHLNSLAIGFMDRGVRCILVIAGAFLGVLTWVLAAIGVGATWTAVQRIVVARRHLQRLEHEGLDPTAAAEDDRSPTQR